MRTFLIAILTGVLGAVIGFVGGDMATRAHHVSNMEGGRAMGVVFLITPAGILAGLVIGVIFAKWIGDPGFLGFAKAQGAAFLATAVLGVIVFGYQMSRAPKAPTIDGATLNLEFEVRMPAGRTAPDSSENFSVLMTSKGYGDDRRNADLDLAHTSQSDGRVVIPATAYLYTSTTQRFLVVNDVDEKYYWFDLPLRAKPKAEDEQWTDWWPKPGQSASSDIRGQGGYQIRYRVQKYVEK